MLRVRHPLCLETGYSMMECRPANGVPSKKPLLCRPIDIDAASTADQQNREVEVGGVETASAAVEGSVDSDRAEYCYRREVLERKQ